METLPNAFSRFFGVALKGQTYLNMLYLLLAFPLGLFYFVFLVTGLSAGIPLLIVWVGLFVLVAVFAAWYGLIIFERQMAITMLREDIPPVTSQDLTGKTMWQKFTATLSNPVTWKGLLYLFAKFPLGTLSFVVLVTFGSISLSLLAAPFYYQYVHPQIGTFTINGVDYYSAWIIDTLPEALAACLVGLLLAFVSMHIFNGLAWVSGKFARLMLGNFSPASAAAVPAQPAASLAVPAADVSFPEAAPAPESTAPEMPSSDDTLLSQ